MMMHWLGRTERMTRASPTPDYVSIVKRLYAAFAQGDLVTVIAETASDVTWIAYETQGFPSAGEYHGHDGVQRFFERDQQTVRTESFVPEEFYAQGSTVVVTGTESGTMAVGTAAVGTVTMKGNWVHIWQFDEAGLVRRFREYLCTTQAASGGARIVWTGSHPRTGSSTRPESEKRWSSPVQAIRHSRILFRLMLAALALIAGRKLTKNRSSSLQ